MARPRILKSETGVKAGPAASSGSTKSASAGDARAAKKKQRESAASVSAAEAAAPRGAKAGRKGAASVRKISLPQRECLLVLGMHRSGTSAITRLLSLLGATLPRNILGAAPGNAMGHWEPERLISYHDMMLAALGSSWDDWGHLDLSRLPVSHRAQIGADIRTILSEEYGKSPLFVVKEPRIARFADFFMSAMEPLGIRSRVIVAYRNPLDVIESLTRRKECWSDGHDRTDAALLWLSHMLSSEKAARALPHAVVSFETVMSDPVTAMKRLADQAGISFPRDIEGAAQEMKDFLVSDEVHHSHKVEDVLLDTRVSTWVAECYIALRDIEVQRNVASARETLDRIAAEFTGAMPILGALTRARREALEGKAVIEGALSETAGQLSQTRTELAEFTAQSMQEQTILRLRLGEADARALATDQRFTQAQAELTDLRSAVESRDRQIAEATERAEKLAAADRAKADALAKAEAHLQEMANVLAAARAREQDARSEIAALLNSTATEEARHQSEQRSAFASLEAAQQQVAQYRTELDTARLQDQANAAQLRYLSGSVGEAQKDTERAWLAYQDLHRVYRSSTSWRISAPVRLIGKAGRAVIGMPSAAISVIRFSGGIGPALKKGIRVMRQEGMAGVRLRMRIARPGSGAAPYSPAVAVQPASHRGDVAAQSPGAPGSDSSSSAKASHPALPALTAGNAYINQMLAHAAPVGAVESYVEKSAKPADFSAAEVQAIAFYLPQFHPIPENDAWWGKGFTEWTNVSKASPQFIGHYQPHLPGELGFYDLRLVDVLREQATLARHFGIRGFCFHHYWFGGQRLLERPFNQLLASPDIDISFCLSWANENWTRRWDGNEQDVLIGQNYSPEDDIAFIKDIAPALRDPRYIRFQGKPLLMVYRASQLPDPKGTAQRWRDWCRREGIGEIYLMAGRTFGIRDPRPYGFDAAVEFPPHNGERVEITSHLQLANPDFEGIVYDFNAYAEGYTDESKDYPILKTVCPGWDNEARKPGRGHIFHGANPQNYGAWLARARAQTLSAMARSDDQPPFVFINAWNEWAEGAHLEPDRRFGYGYLDATAKVLAGETFTSVAPTGEVRPGKAVPGKAQPGVLPPADPTRIIVVSHDANPHGAQMLAWNMCRGLSDTFGLKVDCVLLGGGPMHAQFAEVAQLHDLNGQAQDGPEARALARALRDGGVDVAIVNTTVSGIFARTLAEAGIRVISLVHELPKLIRDYALEPHVAALSEASEKVVFAADLVRDSFLQLSGLDPQKALVRPQGAYKRNRLRSDCGPGSEAARALRAELNLQTDAKILLGVGYADERKGFDLFLDAAERLGNRDNLVFVWVGHHHIPLMARLGPQIDRLQAAGKLVLTGLQTDTDRFFAGADLFILTSREDPYPTTVLEALDVGLPTIGFRGATGTGELILASDGDLAEGFSPDALCGQISQRLAGETGERRRARAREFWQRPDVPFVTYLHDLLDLVQRGPKRVSAVVPNYNYARYLPDRVNTILNQTWPISELIILDDASTDDSAAVIDRIIASTDIPVRAIFNASNSGSVFRQWQRGTEAAGGDYLWIAEADDLAEPGFLATVMRGFDSPDTVLSYCQSKQMAQDGSILCDNYLDYVRDISPVQWSRDYRRGGHAEISQGLSVKNTIPNVSAVVFRREALLATMQRHMDEITSFRVAGDWCAYVRILQSGSCAYSAASLNRHRRHDESVTISRFGQAELDEIIAMQALVASLVDVGALRQTAEAYVRELQQRFGLKSLFLAQ